MALDPQQATSSDIGIGSPSSSTRSSVVAALSVYVEPLVADARVAVLGDGELGLYARLLELGARTIHLYDPDPDRVARIADEVPRGVAVRMLRDDFDVRDGAFDLVVIPDVGMLPDAAGAIVRLRRVIDPRGAVVAMGRARTAATSDTLPSFADAAFPELASAGIEYAELYDVFALQFESVTMTGVLPFRGVVFAELGAGDDLAVSVDTRLVDPEPPGVFVVIASREEEPVLDPYAIVQIERAEVDTLRTEQVRLVAAVAVPVAIEIRATDELHEAAAAFAAMQLKAEMLAQQLDDHRDRAVSADQRAAELEAVLGTAMQAVTTLERRVVAADQGMLERDDQIAALNAELDQQSNLGEDELTVEHIDPALVANLLVRTESAEQALALHAGELAAVAEAHATEMASVEARLRERASVIAAMEKELDRREHLVRELVASLEDARENTAAPLTFEASPVLPGVAPEEVARLRRRLDELALEVARREGELTAQQWQITELENEKARLVRAAATAPHAVAPGDDLARDLAKARDELDALRQALTQEHAARVAAESGEELSRARAELARQGALLQQFERTRTLER
jgi:hypothetical protein